MKPRRRRELQSMLERAGLELIEMHQTGGDHLSVLARAPNGQEKRFTASLTPSDSRANLNQAGYFKRFCRMNQAA